MAPPACGGLGVLRTVRCPPSCPLPHPQNFNLLDWRPNFGTLHEVRVPHSVPILPLFVFLPQTWGPRASVVPSVHSSSVTLMMALTCLPKQEGTPWPSNARRTWGHFCGSQKMAGEAWSRSGHSQHREACLPGLGLCKTRKRGCEDLAVDTDVC